MIPPKPGFNYRDVCWQTQLIDVHALVSDGSPFQPWSQEQTSTRLAAHAVSSATVSAACTLFPDVSKLVCMRPKTSGDSSLGVPEFIFLPIQNSFTTQAARSSPAPAHVVVSRRRAS